MKKLSVIFYFLFCALAAMAQNTNSNTTQRTFKVADSLQLNGVWYNNLIDSTAAAALIDSLAPCGTVSILDYGAVGDRVTDDRDAIQDAIDFVHENGGGTVLFPACDSGLAYRVTLPFYVYDNVQLLGEGKASLVINDRATQTTFGDQFCFYAGNYSPTSYAQTVTYAVQNIAAGRNYIVLTDPTKLDSFIVGQPVLIQSVLGFAGAGGYQRPESAFINIITSKKGADTVYLKYPTRNAITNAVIGNVGHFTNPGSGGSTDGLGHPSYIVKNVTIKNMSFESVAGNWSSRWGIIDFTLENLTIKGFQGIYGNGFCHGFITGINSIFKQKAIEMAMYSHDVQLTNSEFNWIEGDTVDISRPVVRVDENTQYLYINEVSINTGTRDGGPAILVHTARNNFLSHIKITSDSISLAAIEFRSTGDTSRTENNIIENSTFRMSNSLNFIKFTFPVGVTLSTVKGNLVRNCEFNGNLISSKYAVQFSGDSNRVESCHFSDGRIATAALPQSLNGNFLINCYLPSFPYGKIPGVIQINNNTNTGAVFEEYMDTSNVSAGYKSFVNSTDVANDNTAYGKRTLERSTNGDYNTALGSFSQQYQTIGDGNTSAGVQSLQNNISGNYNAAFGMEAMHGGTTASQTAMGYQALYYNETGNHNTAFGREALRGIVGATGIVNNTAIGYGALRNIQGNNNTAVGREAGLNYTGGGNIYVGYNSAPNHISGTNSIKIATDLSMFSYNRANVIEIGNSFYMTNTGASDSTPAANVRAGIGVAEPAGVLELRAGNASTAAVIMNSQTAFTGTVAAGQIALSFDGTDLYSRIGTTNYKITQQTEGLTKISTSGSTPSIAAGTGAGTGATISITGNDVGGKITLTTGTSPVLAGIVFTVTFSQTLAIIPKSVVITAGSGPAANSGSNKLYIDAATLSTTIMELKNIGTALTASTSYIWYYLIVQ